MKLSLASDRQSMVSRPMTHVQAAEPASSSAVRPWLAMLLALLVAMLPGPQIALPGGPDQHLGTPGYALAAIHGRDILARKDAVDTREIGPPALASPASLKLPLPSWAPVSYDYQPWAAILSCALAPCARAPPSFLMTA